MAIIRRKNELKSLDRIPVLIEDTSTNSDFYFNVYDIPEVFPAGKTAFLINGSDNLVLESEVDVEILDSRGNVVYTEYPQYLEGISRTVSVWVYPETLHGEAVITILGEAARILKRRGGRIIEEKVPPEWRGVFNIRWQRIVTINPQRKNNSRIRFYTQPRIIAEEIFQPYLSRVFLSETYEFTNGSILGFQSNDSTYYIMSDGATGSGSLNFFSEMSGAKLTVPFPDITSSIQSNQFPDDLDINNPPVYETRVGKVLNRWVAICDPPYRITSSKPIQRIVTKFSKTTGEVVDQNVFRFGLSSYTMSINTPPTYSLTENFRSYAKLQIVDMGTFSGDVNSLSISMKRIGTIGDFEPVVVHSIETTEQFVVPSTESITLTRRVGVFNSQSVIDMYWSHSLHGNSLPTGSLFITESRMSNAMFFSGSNESRELWRGDYYRIESLVSMSFFKDVEYTFLGSFHGIRKPTLKITELSLPEIVNDARIEIYVSGSAFDMPTTKKFGGKTLTQQVDFGKIIGIIDLDDVIRGNRDEGQLREFQTNFIANQNGSGSLVFIVRSGDWHFTDLSIRQGFDAGFAPDYASIIVPYPDFQRDDKVVFKCEFINALGNKAEIFATSSETFFSGGNVYIQGGDNLVTGSLYVGSFIGSGFEISGKKSAFLRSIGYHGWENANAGIGSGILLWSGSVLESSTSFDPYAGVGFEIHGGSGSSPEGTHALRFRTDTGKLEITGSLFATDGTFTGTITAATGNIGGWSIQSDRIKGNASEMFLSGSGFIATNTSSQRIEIAGNTNDIKFYDNNGFLITRVGENVFASSNGILVQNSGIIAVSNVDTVIPGIDVGIVFNSHPGTGNSIAGIHGEVDADYNSTASDGTQLVGIKGSILGPTPPNKLETTMIALMGDVQQASTNAFAGYFNDKVFMSSLGIGEFKPTGSLDVRGSVGMGNNSASLIRITGSVDISGSLGFNKIRNMEPLFIRGTGFNTGGTRILKIGSSEIYNEGTRGLRLTIIEKNTYSVVLDQTYDTFASTTDADSMAAALTSSMSSSRMGIITSNDAWESNSTSNLKEIFLRFGLTSAAYVGSSIRHPYAAIFDGTPDMSGSRATEVIYHPTGSSPVADIRGWLIDGMFVVDGGVINSLSNAPGSKISLIVDHNGDVKISGSSVIGENVFGSVNSTLTLNSQFGGISDGLVINNPSATVVGRGSKLQFQNNGVEVARIEYIGDSGDPSDGVMRFYTKSSGSMNQIVSIDSSGSVDITGVLSASDFYGSPVNWSFAKTTTQTTDNYLTRNGVQSLNWPSPRNGRLTKLYVYDQDIPGGSNSIHNISFSAGDRISLYGVWNGSETWTIKVRKNGLDTALSSSVGTVAIPATTADLILCTLELLME